MGMPATPAEAGGTPAPAAGAGELKRHLGVFDAVVIGLGSMVGAGVFVALAPAAAAGGSGLLLGLGLAAVVAYCNATSSARLAARYPRSGGTYVYGRERLGEFWGFLAGWGFVVGKTASCAAMALTVGSYVWPGQAHAVAVAAVVALSAVNYLGVQKSAWLTRGVVAVVLAVLAAVVVACVSGGTAGSAHLRIASDVGFGGVLQAAGLLFFAFAGYARIATLGEEVRDPQRTIPGRSRWHWASHWSCTRPSPSPSCWCSARNGSPTPPHRSPKPYAPPACRDSAPSCGPARPSLRWGHCSP